MTSKFLVNSETNVETSVFVPYNHTYIPSWHKYAALALPDQQTDSAHTNWLISTVNFTQAFLVELKSPNQTVVFFKLTDSLQKKFESDRGKYVMDDIVHESIPIKWDYTVVMKMGFSTGKRYFSPLLYLAKLTTISLENWTSDFLELQWLKRRLCGAVSTLLVSSSFFMIGREIA